MRYWVCAPVCCEMLGVELDAILVKCSSVI